MAKPTKTNDAVNDQTFATLLGDLSTSLLRASPGTVDSDIRRFTKRIGECFRVDRVVLRKLTEQMTLATALHYWLRDDQIGLVTELRLIQMPWITPRLFRNDVTRINNRSDLPAEAAAENEILKNAGLQSLLVIPIILDGTLYGNIDLACQERRVWSDRDVEQIGLLADTMIRAHIRARDITSLEANEARYRAVVESQTDFIMRWLPDGTLTWVNDRYCEFWKKSRESLLGTNFLPLLPAVEQRRVLDKVAVMTPDNPTLTDECQWELPNGESGWHSWTDTGIFDSSGKLVEIQSVGRDITSEALSRAAIEKGENLYQTLFESANDAIFYMDGEVVVECNKKTLEIMHCKREELIGKKPWEFSPAFQHGGMTSKETGKSILKALESGEPQRFAWVHSQPDGTLLDTEVSLTPIELVQGGSRLLAIARDVTDARRAQREIEHRAAFQSLLAELSTELAVASEVEIEETINQVFVRVGIRYGLSSIAIWWYSEDKTRQVADRKAGWQRDGASGPLPPGRVVRAELPWLASEMSAGRDIQVNDTGDLPESAGIDKTTLEKREVLALLGFPIRVKEKVVGACYMTTSEPRGWSTEEFEELRLIANCVSGSFARSWAVEGMLRRQRDLTRSQEAAHVGTFSLRYDEPKTEFSKEGKVEMTDEFCKLFGIEDKHESAGLVISRIQPDDALHVVKSIEESFETGARKKMQTHRVIRPDGSMIHVDGWVEVDRDEEGRVLRLFGTALNVTEQIKNKKEIQNALAEIEKLKNQLQEENLYLRKEIRTAHNFGKIIGSSPKLKQALVSVEKVAPTDIPVLILGETGSGKDLITQAIYDLSERKDKALITVNCAALSEDLIESEIFGHEKGAFTGAEGQRKGRFELADGGTLFLDEIGELPGKLQAKLLRVLQTGELERLGGTKTLRVDVRLITATNRDLQAAVNEGRFRADLYYRISTFPIELPPLRERPEDIPDLAEFFVRKHAKRMGKEIRSISASLIRYLTRQEWPGNVRELEGFIQRALISASGHTLDFLEQPATQPDQAVSTDIAPGFESTRLQDAEHQHILKILEKTGWVIDGKNGAASMMGLAPSTLRSKMKRLGIERPA